MAIVFVSGVGDVAEATVAGRRGAIGFIRKPFKRAELLACIAQAEEEVPALVIARERRNRLRVVKKLTPRELDVLRALAEGLQSKQAAHRLGLSARTVEAYRASITKKLQTSVAGSIAAG